VSGLSGDCPLLSFHIGSRDVQTLPTTVFSGGNCSKLKEKNNVTVTGVLQLGNFILASKIDLKH
jgi:hypothetical protein